MPKKEMNYSNTYFYRIVCKDLNIKDCYVGHTTNFKNRKSQHKQSCINENSKEYNYNVYQFIRNNGGWENWDMIIIEQINCENFNEACKIERKYLEEYKANLNKIVPIRTQEENEQYFKKWCDKNIDKIKDNRKDYYINNSDKIKQCQKKYYEEHKEKIKENNKSMVYCDCCKKEIGKNNSLKHFKTKNHINNSLA
jgi:hypothetical protein